MKIDLNAVAHKRNPETTYGPLREAGPLADLKIPLIGNVQFVLRHADVERVLKDHETFAVDPQNAGVKTRAGMPRWTPKFLKALANNMAAVDEPDHKRLRSIVNTAFSRRSVDGLEAQIEDLVDQALNNFEASRNGDWVAHVGRPIPMAVICELLGVPAEDRERFGMWTRSLLQGSVSKYGLVFAIPRLLQIVWYLRSLAKKRRLEPQDDLITRIVTANVDGQSLDDDEVSGMLNLLIIAGHETTVHLLGSGMAVLADRPDIAAQIRADPELVPAFVEEMLRVTAPFEVAGVRYVTRDTDIDGAKLKRGDKVLPCLASANFDPRAFEFPHDVRLDRQPNPHLTFGGGIHFCLGVMLARLEARIVFRKAVERWDEIDAVVPTDEREWFPALGLRGLKALPLKVRSA